ncbi:MAG: prepilin peptidase [Kofleriaceae bacterium]
MRSEVLAQLAAGPGGAVFAVLLGLLWGSFANVCIYRWPPSEGFPRGRSVVLPPSHCFACQTPIRWYDNLPLVAYLWLRGRCRACGVRFSARYLIVEALTGALFGVAWWTTLGAGVTGATLASALLLFTIAAAFCFVMVVVTFIDLDHRLILDRVTLPSVVIFAIASLAWPGGAWWSGLVGAAVGYGVIWLVAEVYYRLTGREGMGLGDAKLLAVIGALLGWRGVLAALSVGSLLGSVIGVTVLVIARRRAPVAAPEVAPSAPVDGDAPADGDPAEPAPGLRHAELPFGPFLAAAAVLYLFAEPWLVANFHLLRL